ncbi:TetR-family transcriptional regulator [Xenorhabdus poinarii G6]|uniref:TetR-family transcriptional regulator n=1 Tax=Xenorhabdus poinarii G6 TaxID=1354304 RepID=A0A068R627_9GAMM|nr:TetR/AcrR family transcriptional regulator [Xenorhabdus poinarii]CDG22356.1 TetR-family transcriptional regulator [Xenorhabdus poinarii G6]
MTRRTRLEMKEETRIKLLITARHAFGSLGYFNTSMDDFTAKVGLTRGALYHHFGDKKGLLMAVVEQIDAEMDQHLQSISDNTIDSWAGFRDRCRAYLAMSLNSEFQQIVLKDSRIVLGDRFRESQTHCISSMRILLERMILEKKIKDVDTDVLACLINGSLVEAALWIAEDTDPETKLSKTLSAFDLMLEGLKRS